MSSKDPRVKELTEWFCWEVADTLRCKVMRWSEMCCWSEPWFPSLSSFLPLCSLEFMVMFWHMLLPWHDIHPESKIVKPILHWTLHSYKSWPFLLIPWFCVVPCYRHEKLIQRKAQSIWKVYVPCLGTLKEKHSIWDGAALHLNLLRRRNGG